MPAGAILIARAGIIGGPVAMGAKYLPTIKDLKASQRFQQKQTLPKSPFKKPDAAPAAPKKKQK